MGLLSRKKWVCDSYACFWFPFLPVSLPCPSPVPALSYCTSFCMFGCYLREAWIFVCLFKQSIQWVDTKIAMHKSTFWLNKSHRNYFSSIIFLLRHWQDNMQTKGKCLWNTEPARKESRMYKKCYNSTVKNQLNEKMNQNINIFCMEEYIYGNEALRM